MRDTELIILYVNKTRIMFSWTNSILLRHYHILNKMTIDKQNILFITCMFIKKNDEKYEKFRTRYKVVDIPVVVRH